MNYKIVGMEQKETSKGVVLKVTLQDSTGIRTEGVTIWSSFPNFSELNVGSNVDGDIITTQNGKYTNRSLYEKRTDTLTNPKAPKWAQMKQNPVKVEEVRNKNIEKNMERKEMSIAYFNSCNLALQSIGGQAFTQELFIERRDFFYGEWNKWEAKGDNEKKIPF